jgi:hypothetical protein
MSKANLRYLRTYGGWIHDRSFPSIAFGFLMCCVLSWFGKVANPSQVSERTPMDAEGTVFRFNEESLRVESMLFKKVPGRRTRLILFVGREIAPHFTYRLAVFDESLVSVGKYRELLSHGLRDGHPDFLHYSSPGLQRDVELESLDLDGDGTEDAVWSGGGGAGATSVLQVLKFELEAVRLLYSGSSRFPILLFPEMPGSLRFAIANAGFEFRIDGDHQMVPKAYDLYSVRNDVFQKSREVEPTELQRILDTLEKRRERVIGCSHLVVYGNPISPEHE